MIKAVVFDMFETLGSLFIGLTYFSEHMAADVGADPDAFTKEWRALQDDRSVGRYTISEAVGLVLKSLNMYSEEKVNITVEKRIQSLKDTFDAIPKETFMLLNELKNRGLKIGLITNTFSDERDFIRESKLFPYFDEVLISYEEGLIKPDVRMYEKMIELLQVEAEECLYVGDGGSKELYGARDAGMHAVQCTWFHHLAYDPHVPCPILDEFEHADTQLEVLKFLDL